MSGWHTVWAGLAAEWAAVQPNLVASLIWAAPAFVLHLRHRRLLQRLHRKVDRLHARLDQQPGAHVASALPGLPDAARGVPHAPGRCGGICPFCRLPPAPDQPVHDSPVHDQHGGAHG